MEPASETQAPIETSEMTSYIHCWACARESRVPVWFGTAIPIVKCWWCAALIENIQLDAEGNCVAQPTNSGRSGRSTSQKILGYAMVMLVIGIIGVVAGGGVYYLLPATLGGTRLSFSLPILQFLALALALAIYASYAAILLRHPGRVSLPVVGIAIKNSTKEETDIGRGELNDWRWCHSCDNAKPPTAHHCRRCGFCVDGLDHHCLFTANRCIGHGNIAPFLRFLVLVLPGCLFACAAAVGMGWRQRGAIIRHTLITWYRPAPFGTLLHALTFIWRWVLWAPVPLAVWALTFMFAFSTLFGVGALLMRQITVRSQGTTWLDELQRRRMEVNVMTNASGELNGGAGRDGSSGGDDGGEQSPMNGSGGLETKIKGM